MSLNISIDYDKAAQIAKKAYSENTTLKEAAIDLGFVTADDFDRYVKPEEMIG